MVKLVLRYISRAPQLLLLLPSVELSPGRGTDPSREPGASPSQPRDPGNQPHRQLLEHRWGNQGREGEDLQAESHPCVEQELAVLGTLPRCSEELRCLLEAGEVSVGQAREPGGCSSLQQLGLFGFEHGNLSQSFLLHLLDLLGSCSSCA